MASYCYYNADNPYAILGALSIYNKDNITYIPISNGDEFDPLRHDRIRPGSLLYFIDMVPNSKDLHYLVNRDLILCVFSSEPSVLTRVERLKGYSVSARRTKVTTLMENKLFCPAISKPGANTLNVLEQISSGALGKTNDVSNLSEQVNKAYALLEEDAHTHFVINGLLALGRDVPRLWRALNNGVVFELLQKYGVDMANSLEKLTETSMMSIDTIHVSIGSEIIEVPCVNTQIEETLIELAGIAPFAIRYHITKRHYIFYLRSTEGGKDVGSIARQLNGNGDARKATIIIDCTMVNESPKRFLMNALQNLKETYLGD